MSACLLISIVCVCVVVSPLISLMIDQVTRLRSIGVGSAILSGNSGVDKCLLATEKDIKSGSFALLFSAPEAFISSDCWRNIFIEEPLCDQVVSLVVDEAHCVYKWGAKNFVLLIHEFMSFGVCYLSTLLC